ncbi:hypothetical protein D3C87_2187660 [compost metagenome]
MYFALLHARGRTRATAMLHLVEVPLYIATLLALTKAFGVSGAAIAWSLRMCVDAWGLKLLVRHAK